MEKKIRPQDIWNEKAGYVSKSYKLKADVVEAFAETCSRKKVSLAGKLTELMTVYIEENKK